jgi:hypothetical protein
MRYYELKARPSQHFFFGGLVSERCSNFLYR